ncbi:MAG: hypothetical protein QXR39_07100 [Candidatus Methanomethylicia archaeon]
MTIIYWPIETIILIIIIAFTIIFASLFILTFYMFTKGLMKVKLYYPPKTINEISKELICPKCSSKDLKPVGYRTLRCEKCGFTFSIGFGNGFWISPLLLWFPILLPFLPIFIWKKKKWYYF